MNLFNTEFFIINLFFSIMILNISIIDLVLFSTFFIVIIPILLFSKNLIFKNMSSFL